MFSKHIKYSLKVYKYFNGQILFYWFFISLFILRFVSWFFIIYINGRHHYLVNRSGISVSQWYWQKYSILIKWHYLGWVVCCCLVLLSSSSRIGVGKWLCVSRPILCLWIWWSRCRTSLVVDQEFCMPFPRLWTGLSWHLCQLVLVDGCDHY